MSIIEQIEQLKQRAAVRGAASAELTHPQWVRLYVKYNRLQGVILSNIEAAHPGQGALTKLIAELQSAGYTVSVECPQPRLLEWCKRNDVPVL